MSAELESLRDEFEQFFARICPDSIIYAVVDKINDDDTIDAKLNDDKIIEGVRLKSVIKSGNKKLLVPSLKSTVLIGRIEKGNEFSVLNVESIDKEILLIDTVRIETTSDGLTVKKGDDTLKDVFTLIIQAVQQIMVLYGNNPDYGKLTQAQTKIDNILK